MTTLSQKSAIELLGQYAHNQQTGELLESRVERLIEFSKENENITIETNNNWQAPPKPSKAKVAKLLGGVTKKYQVWAVVR